MELGSFTRSEISPRFIATGQLIPLLEEWMPPSSEGFCPYYRSRRQNLASLGAFIEFFLRLWTQQRNHKPEITGRN